MSVCRFARDILGRDLTKLEKRNTSFMVDKIYFLFWQFLEVYNINIYEGLDRFNVKNMFPNPNLLNCNAHHILCFETFNTS